MTITIYHFPPSAPSRAALLTARVLSLNVNVKEINLFKKEQLKQEFVKVSSSNILHVLIYKFIYSKKNMSSTNQF